MYGSVDYTAPCPLPGGGFGVGARPIARELLDRLPARLVRCFSPRFPAGVFWRRADRHGFPREPPAV